MALEGATDAGLKSSEIQVMSALNFAPMEENMSLTAEVTEPIPVVAPRAVRAANGA